MQEKRDMIPIVNRPNHPMVDVCISPYPMASFEQKIPSYPSNVYLHNMVQKRAQMPLKTGSRIPATDLQTIQMSGSQQSNVEMGYNMSPQTFIPINFHCAERYPHFQGFIAQDNYNQPQCHKNAFPGMNIDPQTQPAMDPASYQQYRYPHPPGPGEKQSEHPR
ncbi:hypothetical protein RF11_04539 [Thelohanellus kitauei]|uniref:Uncharacterized protein n=1 Tax=Thelohanellus kitauei TaxID=669202 RepID=A0A0C2JEL7_THEKT|nr:hypothetical protein RF11_04539 [Thelohanellus kitauei]